MKLKMFSMFAVVLFMSSSVNLNANSENNSLGGPYECWGVADTTLSSFQTANANIHQIATAEQENNVWNSAYDACMGAQQPVIIGNL